MKTVLSRSVTSPKSKALWLINNTSLTFKQIADFCSIHELEVKSIADGVMSSSLREKSPIVDNEITIDQIHQCEKNPLSALIINHYGLDESLSLKIKNKTYISVAKRQNKPSAILWLKNNIYGITVKDIKSITGATSKMIESIIAEKYRLINEVSPKDPVSLGICTQMQLNTLIQKYKNNESLSS
jgi:hypothetical protein